ncbi:MAG: hypothetical protein KAG34_05090 [Cocleimonas sp.]|nr:hypothetical protein [Cocleimonas sp.]
MEGLEVVAVALKVLTWWGAFAGIVVAAGITYITSLYLWDEFHIMLFTTLCVPFLPIGMYIQYKIEMPSRK